MFTIPQSPFLWVVTIKNAEAFTDRFWMGCLTSSWLKLPILLLHHSHHIPTIPKIHHDRLNLQVA